MTTNPTTPSSPWLVIPQPRPDARVRLLCLPYAGGAASVFRGWAERLPDDVEVVAIQLPGRERRLREPLLHDMHSVVQPLLEVVAPLLTRPFALFGHSLGACVAYELARQLRRLYGREPVHLFASARRAPHLPDPAPLHPLPEPDLIAALRRLGGTPESVLADPELMRLFVPILRADLTIAETYVCSSSPPLRCPLTMLHGDADPMVGEHEALAWRQHTSGPFALHRLSAGHLFLATHEPVILPWITDALRRA